MTDDAANDVRLRTLGGLSLEGLGSSSLGRRQLALLAMLAIAGDRGISRDRIIALLWPESDEDRARNSLSQVLSAIRREFDGEDPFEGTVELRLANDVLTSDVEFFERSVAIGHLEEAVAVYSGPFLDGFFIKEAGGFEQWADQHRARLQAKYVACLTRLAERADAAGSLANAVGWWRQLAALDPGSIQATTGLIRARTRAGDRAGALQQYRVHEAFLRREFDVAPHASIVDLVNALGRDMPGRADVPNEDGRRVGTTTDPTEAVPGLRQRGQARTFRLPLAVASAGVGMIVLSAALYRNSSSHVRPELVAIGAFENRSGDSSLTRFADAVAASIARLLSDSPRASVIDLRDSISSGTSADARVAMARSARRSRAAHLVQGVVEQRGADVVAAVQVLDAQSGHLVYQLDPVVVSSAAPESALVLLREGVGGALMALNDTVFRASWGHSRPPRYSSYHAFLRGIDAIVQQNGQVAIPHLLKSMTLDPDFVPPKLLYLKQVIWNAAERPRLDSVRAALVAQRPRMGAYDQAATDEKLAFLDGRLEDTFTAARQMVALAPDSPDALAMLAQAAMATRRYRRAIEALHSLRRSPGWLREMRSERVWDLQAHRLLGEHDIAIAEWRGFVTTLPNDDSVCRQGFAVLAAAGRAAEVDSLLVSCVGADSGRLAVALRDVGRHFRVAGNHDGAERAFTRHLAIRIQLAARDSNLRYEIGVALMQLRRWREAYELMRTLTLANGVAAPGEVFRTLRRPRGQLVTFAIIAAHVGDTLVAGKTLRWLEGENKRDGADMDRGLILAALGRKAEALEALQQAMHAGIAPAWSAWYIREEFDPLREDPRFQALIRPISCTPGC